MPRILDGNRVRDEIKSELKPRVDALAAHGRTPGLAWAWPFHGRSWRLTAAASGSRTPLSAHACGSAFPSRPDRTAFGPHGHGRTISHMTAAGMSLLSIGAIAILVEAHYPTLGALGAPGVAMLVAGSLLAHFAKAQSR